MKIGFVVNDIKTEETGYTTSRLGVAAVNLGHEVWVMGVGDLAYDPDDTIRARARSVPKKKYTTSEGYLRDLQGKNAIVERITVDELDVLLLRNDPATDVIYRPWAVDRGHAVRPRGHAPRRDRAERSERPGAGDEQDVLPALPGRGAAEDADHARPRRDQGVRQGAGRHHRAQAAAGLGRPERLPGAAGRRAEPESDDRCRQPRRLRHRPGVPARRRRGRHASVSDERPAAALQGQVRRVPPRAHGRRHALEHPRRRASSARPRSTPRRCASPRSSGRSSCRTACSSSAWTSSATS